MSTSFFDTEKSTTDPDPSSSIALVCATVNVNPSSILFSAERKDGLDDLSYVCKLRKKEDLFDELVLDLRPRLHVGTTSSQLNDFMETIYCTFNFASIVFSPLHHGMLVGGRCLHCLVE